MPTNDRKTNLYERKLLSKTAIKDYFLDYLQGAIDEVGTAYFAGSSGTLDQDKVGLNNGHGGSTFDIDTTDAQKVLAGNHVIDLTVITGAGITHTIPFENSVGVTYHVGVHYAEVEVGIEINPRTGDPEYVAWKQTFGNVANPTSVTDHVSYIRLVLTSITEAGASHAGRKCKVWLVDPVSRIESIAFYEGTIAYVGGLNVLDIPYSGASGPLGQDTSAAPPSTNAVDYKVFIEGISWRRFTDLSLVGEYSYLGYITGGSPPSFNTDDQPILQLVSLDKAYDGIPGPGSGRAIDVDAGAVELNTDSGGPDDLHNAQLRLSRLASTDYFQLSLEVLMGDSSSIPLLLVDEFGGIQDEECSVSGDTITFSTCDPTAWWLDKQVQFVWIKNGAATGVYAIYSITSTTIVCRDFQTGASPAWGAESGLVASVMQPRMVFSNSAPSAYSGALQHWRGLLLTGIDGNGYDNDMLNICPGRGTGALVHVKNNRVDYATGMMNQRDMIFIDFDAPAVGNPGGRVQMGQWVGTVGSEAGVHTKCGFDFRPLVNGSGAADKYAFNVKPQPLSDDNPSKPSARMVGLHDDHGVEMARWVPWGRLADTHRFVDRFDYAEAAVGWPGSERWWARTWGNGGTASFNDTNIFGTGMQGQGDILHIDTAGIASGDGLSWEGAACWILRATGGTNRKLKFYARARPIQVNTCVWYGVGIFSGMTTTNVIQFRLYDTLNVGTNWELHCRTAGGSDNYGPAATFDSSGNWNNDLGWLDFWFEVDPQNNAVTYWMTGMTSPSGMNIKVGGLAASDWRDMRVQPFLHVSQVGVLGTNVRRFEVDHIEAWDENIVAGPKE